MRILAQIFLIPLIGLAVAGCRSLPRTGDEASRTGDEIVAAGKFFHAGTRVVLWMDPGGYDAYRVEKRFGPIEQSDWKTSSAVTNTHLTTPNRYGLRRALLTTNQIEKVRGGGWDLPLLQSVVDQFVPALRRGRHEPDVLPGVAG